MKFKKLESGRSMVEMLGVLAIIGVLSVGGIAGYSLSMRRHRANGVVDLVSKYALVAYNNCQQEILNGETSSIDNCTMTDFQDADIGPVPAGVHSMFVSSLSTSSEGHDEVRIGVSFTDPKLCHAAGSISGLGCQGNASVFFEIKQN